MGNMKCPFCGKELTKTLTTNPFGLGRIDMAYCKHCSDKLHLMPLWDWQELITTRKALDIAVDALKWIAYDENGEQDGLEEFAISQMMEKADEAINQIIALEQKD